MSTTPVPSITADCLVEDVVEQHPQTIPVFIRNGLGCVGCYIAPFHTISDTAREYTLSLERLLCDLNQALAEGQA